MSYYYGAVVWYFLVLVGGKAANSLRIALPVMMLPMVTMACLRGLVGTDTGFYISLFKLMDGSDKIQWFFEPFFTLIVYTMMPIIGDAHSLLLLMAGFTSLLLITAALKLERQPLMFAIMIVPYQYFDFTMNAVRLGLAVGFSMWALVFLVRRDRTKFVILAIVASQIHLSSIVLTAGTWLLLEARIRTVLTLSVLGTSAYLALATYINDKFAAYSEIETESGLTGLAPLILGNLTLLAISFNSRFRYSNKLQITVLFLMVNALFFLTQITYAGVRFQALLLALIYCYIVSAAHRDGMSVKNGSFWILLMTAILSCIFRLRNYSSFDDQQVGVSSFVPYHFFWEMQL
jgi:hypothetical protein